MFAAVQPNSLLWLCSGRLPLDAGLRLAAPSAADLWRNTGAAPIAAVRPRRTDIAADAAVAPIRIQADAVPTTAGLPGTADVAAAAAISLSCSRVDAAPAADGQPLRAGQRRGPDAAPALAGPIRARRPLPQRLALASLAALFAVLGLLAVPTLAARTLAASGLAFPGSSRGGIVRVSQTQHTKGPEQGSSQGPAAGAGAGQGTGQRVEPISIHSMNPRNGMSGAARGKHMVHRGR